MESKKRKNKNRQAMRQLLVQPLESRVVLAASMGWDGAGQGSAELTYYIANHPSSLTQAETNQAIESALNAWSSVANIKFTQTNQPGLKDSLDFSFSNIDGVSKTLAQSYYPDDVNSARLAGDVQFDSSESWEVGNSKGSQAFDLTYVAAHEIGHALGLDHSSAAGSVMSETASPNTAFTGLSDADKAAILKLYAAADTSSSTSDTSSSDSSTSSGSEGTSSGSGSTTTTDTDTVPFPKERWRHGGQFQRFGSRFDASASFNHNVYLPSDVNGDSSVTPSDAITVINILNNGGVSSLDLNSLGLVDTNGDGSVSPSDALIVINTLNGSSRITVILVTANSTSTTDSGTTDETDTSSSGSTDTTTTDSGTTETGSTDSGSTETESSDTGSSDSGTTDTTDTGTTETDTTDTTDSTDCHGGSTTDGSTTSVSTTGASAGTPNRSAILAWFNADSLISKFDTDASGTLTEAEVPEHLWQLLVDSSVDSDSDLAVSQTELQTAIETARQDLFNSKDADSDGQLTSTEVGTRIWSSLSTADTDSSGGVSFAEFDTYVSQNANNGMPPGGGHGGRGGHHEGRGHGGNEMGGERRGGMGAPELWQLAADSLFAEFDADSDGILTSSELPSKILSDLLGKNVDANSDGSISTDELTSAISTARETYFSSKDTDANGQLSSSEVGKRAWRFISSADTDSDGTVSLEEFQAWTPSKPSGHGPDSSSTPTIAISIGSSASNSSTLISSVIGRLVGHFGRR